MVFFKSKFHVAFCIKGCMRLRKEKKIKNSIIIKLYCMWCMFSISLVMFLSCLGHKIPYSIYSLFMTSISHSIYICAFTFNLLCYLSFDEFVSDEGLAWILFSIFLWPSSHQNFHPIPDITFSHLYFYWFFFTTFEFFNLICELLNLRILMIVIFLLGFNCVILSQTHWPMFHE